MTVSAKNAARRLDLVAEAFESGQLAQTTGAASAISRMAARFAAGDDALAALVRKRQNASERWLQLDKALTTAVGRQISDRDKSKEAVLRREQAETKIAIKEIDRRLETAFPQFAELTSPKPIPLAELQKLLGEDEALITYFIWGYSSHVFVITRDKAIAERLEVEAEDLRDAVGNLRQSLNLAGVRQLSDIRPFNRTNAFDLYQKLFKPAEPLLEGVRHIFVVPDGPLQSLPLGVLVTEEPQGSFEDFGGYRQVPWLARRYAMTVLPSVSSLRALRAFAKRSKATKPFLGIGDPDLKGRPGSGRGVQLASLFTARGVADVRSVRNLAALPESAGELKALAATLKAGPDALVLRGDATETWIKSADLADRKVIAFATHGLVAGDLTGLSEPALVLTPPEEGTELDDGLLTASEVAQLKLDPEWVILSACNTASPDGTPGAEGLSGLAKAFFYAGTRALLVSHWPVASDAAVKITTRMLAEAAKPGVGRAEAHRRAMLSLLDQDQPDHFAHPAFWAPFVVVGEGGVVRR